MGQGANAVVPPDPAVPPAPPPAPAPPPRPPVPPARPPAPPCVPAAPRPPSAPALPRAPPWLPLSIPPSARATEPPLPPLPAEAPPAARPPVAPAVPVPEAPPVSRGPPVPPESTDIASPLNRPLPPSVPTAARPAPLAHATKLKRIAASPDDGGPRSIVSLFLPVIMRLGTVRSVRLESQFRRYCERPMFWLEIALATNPAIFDAPAAFVCVLSVPSAWYCCQPLEPSPLYQVVVMEVRSM